MNLDSAGKLDESEANALERFRPNAENTFMRTKQFLCQLLFVFCLLFVSFAAHAKWIVTVTPNSEIQAPYRSLSVMQRFIETSKGSYSIGVVTNNVLNDMPGQPKNEDEWAEQLRIGLKAPAWKKDKLGSAFIYTLNWKQENIYLRLVVEHKSKRWITSLANIRQPYVLMTAYEAELLQLGYFKIQEKNIQTAQWTPYLWRNFAPEAEAALDSEQLSRVVRGFDSHLNSTSSNLGVNSAKELSGALGRLGSDGKIIATDVMRGMNRSADILARTESHVSETLQKITSFKNMFLSGAGFGLGMGAGAAVGTAVTNFFLDGSAKLARNLFYEFTSKLKPEERVVLEARAGKAFDQLAVQSQKLEEIQSDLILHGLAVAQATRNPSLSLIEQSEADSEDLNDQLKHAQNALSLLPLGDKRSECARKVADLRNQIEFLKNMKPIFSKFKNFNDVCGALKKHLDGWKLAEISLHQAKVTLSFEMLTILGGAKSRQLDAVSDPVSIAKRVKDCETKSTDLVSRHMELYKAQKCGERPADLDCMNYAKQMQLGKEVVETCKADQKMMDASLSAGVLARENQGSNEELAILRSRMHQILKSDCKQGDKSEVCDGQPGDLEILRQSQDNRVLAAQTTCGGQIQKSPPPGVSEESLKTGFPENSPDLKTVTKAREPQAESKSNLFSTAWSSITGFFSRFTSK